MTFIVYWFFPPAPDRLRFIIGRSGRRMGRFKGFLICDGVYQVQKYLSTRTLTCLRIRLELPGPSRARAARFTLFKATEHSRLSTLKPVVRTLGADSCSTSTPDRDYPVRIRQRQLVFRKTRTQLHSAASAGLLTHRIARHRSAIGEAGQTHRGEGVGAEGHGVPQQ
jgi:hypothetical protein